MKVNNQEYSDTQAFWDYCLNRFMPWIVMGAILFLSFGLWDWRPYFVLGILWFVERNCYNMGYSVCFCKEKGMIDFGDDAHKGP